jgi:small subunit ribosomal protein S7
MKKIDKEAQLLDAQWSYNPKSLLGAPSCPTSRFAITSGRGTNNLVPTRGLPNLFAYLNPVLSHEAAPSMTRFINFLTKKGKKTKADFIFQKALAKVLDLVLTERPLVLKNAGVASLPAVSRLNPASSFFEEALSNLKPSFEVKKVRVAGSTYQVPSLISPKRQENLAINWLLQSSRERRKKTKTLSFEECLGIEIFEAYKKQGSARTKRNELHKLAEQNRAFAHYRWW